MKLLVNLCFGYKIIIISFFLYNCYLMQCISQQPRGQVINDTFKHLVLKLSVSFYQGLLREDRETNQVELYYS